ncbi:MAG: shikimate kinase [Acidobacteria bacterium]|nr:shikimate kinase [Acidobacteriota bacterium]
MNHSRIYLIGFMGAGKSTVGRALAQRLGWKFIDLDEAIEHAEGRSVATIFKESGEAYFRERERTHLQGVSKTEQAVIALGGGAFMDAGNRAVAEQTGLTVWLKVSFAKAASRVKMDGTRPMFASREQAENLHRSREACYTLAKVHVSTDDRSAQSVVDEIFGVIGNI